MVFHFKLDIIPYMHVYSYDATFMKSNEEMFGFCFWATDAKKTMKRNTYIKTKIIYI